jgi:hypothetical protein
LSSAPEDSLARVALALDAELERLGSSRTIERLPVVVLSPQPTTVLPRLAVVAADAGNLELRVHPLRIGFLRLATSAAREPVGEAFVPLSRGPQEQLDWVFREPSMARLAGAAQLCGLDVDRVADWLPVALPSEYSLHFLRELLEWLLLVHTAMTAPPGTLVLRDGLLRSVALPHVAFAPILRTLRAVTRERGVFVCALAKRAPGGPDFLSYLDLAVGAQYSRNGTAMALEVPPHVEEQFSPRAWASTKGRRGGALFLLAAAPTRLTRPMAVEVPLWQRDRAGELLASLLHHGRGGYPEPGYPPELLAAHQAARVSPLHRELLARLFLRRLAAVRPQLRERLLAAHLVGGTLVLEPSAAEGSE